MRALGFKVSKHRLEVSGRNFGCDFQVWFSALGLVSGLVSRFRQSRLRVDGLGPV